MIDAILDGLARVERGNLEGYPIGWRECLQPARWPGLSKVPPSEFDSARDATESTH